MRPRVGMFWIGFREVQGKANNGLGDFLKHQAGSGFYFFVNGWRGLIMGF